ncbi:MAG: hypothetical protein WDA53_02615 [Bacillota bacterium]
MRAQITLTSSESKRLIAKGVTALPNIQQALREHTIILAGGTTNAFIAEELLGQTIEKKSTYSVGIITEGKTGVSIEEGRINPYVITKGKAREKSFHWKDYLPEMVPGDIFIKGGNAIDHTGLAAVLASNAMGGTIGIAWGPVMQRGIELIVPIGLEKLVPDVRAAVEFLAARPADEAIGNRATLMPMLGATVVTEITALKVLYNVETTCIAAGGVAGSEGAVTLVLAGEEQNVRQALAAILAIKGEPPVS